MKDDRLPDEMLLSEAQVRDVIERAARAEPRSRGMITVAELREIALELDIDPLAFDRALDRVIGLPLPGRPVRSWIKRRITKLGRFLDRCLPERGRVVMGGIFGAMAGSLNAFLAAVGVQAHYPIAIAMVGFTAANLLSRRIDRRFRRFLAETLATWGLYAGLWSLTHGGVTGNLVIWCAFWASLAVVAGWILVRDPSSGGDGLPPLTDPSDVSRGRLPGGEDESGLSRHDMLLWPAVLCALRPQPR